MSMSPAYHLFGKAMRGEALNENQVKEIVGVIRKDERLRERERTVQLLRARVTAHHAVLEMHIEELEAIIRGQK